MRVAACLLLVLAIVPILPSFRHAEVQDPQGPELHRLLEEDLALWKIEAPKLPAAWFDFPQEAHERIARLCRGMGRTVQCLRGVRTEKYAPARRTIAALRDLWVDTPALKVGYAGFSTVIKECDATLNALR